MILEVPSGWRGIVIGYGNPLRRDDGIGPQVAAEIAALELPGIRTLAVHQLTPELAEELARSERAIFVDASVGGPAVDLCRVEPSDSCLLTHACSPVALLQLAGLLYGRTPQAWLVTIRGEDFGTGEGLSETARQAAETAVRSVRMLLE